MTARRQSDGTRSLPLTYSEIVAFCSIRKIDLARWEVDLITRCDDVVMAIWANPRPGNNAAKVTDTAGVRQVMQGLAAKMRAKSAASNPPEERSEQ